MFAWRMWQHGQWLAECKSHNPEDFIQFELLACFKGPWNGHALDIRATRRIKILQVLQYCWMSSFGWTIPFLSHTIVLDFFFFMNPQTSFNEDLINYNRCIVLVPSSMILARNEGFQSLISIVELLVHWLQLYIVHHCVNSLHGH